MALKKVLIVSNPEDEHTKKVATKIAEQGGEPILFYPEQLGERAHFRMSLPLRAHRFQSVLIFNSTIVDLNQVYSVWYRRPRPETLAPYKLSPEALEFAHEEWRAAVEGLYSVMEKSLWVSHPDRLREASRKPLQLIIAQQIGLAIPRTLITNEPDQIAEFIEECNGRVIVKPTGAGWVYSEDNNQIIYVLTNRPSLEDINALDDVKIAPITIQEEIPKAYEVRANVVGQQVLTVCIQSQQSPISSLDWRRYDVKRTPYSPYQLPTAVEQKCLRVVQLLGLEFGAIDLIRKPDGEYVFLEINGNGQFLWAEELSGIEVSSTLASLLLGVAPSLQSTNLI